MSMSFRLGGGKGNGKDAGTGEDSLSQLLSKSNTLPSKKLVGTPRSTLLRQQSGSKRETFMRGSHGSQLQELSEEDFNRESGIDRLEKQMFAVQSRLNALQRRSKGVHGRRRNRGRGMLSMHGRAQMSEGHEFRQRVRTRALEMMKMKELKYIEQLKAQYKPMLDREIMAIIDFPEEVGSVRAKEKLVKMRKGIFQRRILLEVERKKLDEWNLKEMLAQAEHIIREEDASATERSKSKGLHRTTRTFKLTQLSGPNNESSRPNSRALLGGIHASRPNSRNLTSPRGGARSRTGSPRGNGGSRGPSRRMKLKSGLANIGI